MRLLGYLCTLEVGYAYTHECEMLTNEIYTWVQTCTTYVGISVCYRLRKIRAYV